MRVETGQTAQEEALGELWQLTLRIDAQYDHYGEVCEVAIHPGGACFAIGFDSGLVALGSTNSEDLASASIRHDGGVYALEFSPDGELLASGGPDGVVVLHDVDCFSLRITSDPIHVRHGFSGLMRRMRDFGGPYLGFGPNHAVLSLTFSPNASRILSGSEDGNIDVFDFRSKKRIYSWKAHELGVRALLATSDRARFISGSEGEVRFWDATSLSMIRSISLQPEGWYAAGIYGLVEIPGIQRIAALVSVSGGIECRIWDILTGELLRVISHECDGPGVLTNNLLAVVAHVEQIGLSMEGRVLFWDWNEGVRANTEVSTAYSQITSVSSSKNGRLLAVANRKGIEIWQRGDISGSDAPNPTIPDGPSPPLRGSNGR